ncbi:MAG: hypothetical protein HUK06_01490 [Bacteroidaceae bacterium]|nr:hypothetical protein [Bacteroidaceae bacterium]
MRKKSQNNAFVTRVKGAEELKEAVTRLKGEGYFAYTKPQRIQRNEKMYTWNDFISEQLRSGEEETGKTSRKKIPSLYFSTGNEITATVPDCGTPGLGYIEWGFGNILPNMVGLLTQMNPYTAAGCKFNDDMLAGLGPKAMYDIVDYVGGNITTKKIRYKDAGVYIQGKIKDLWREISNLETKTIDGTPSMPEAVSSLKASILSQIAQYEADYAEWQRTSNEVQEFEDRNNLPQTWLKLCIDQVMFGISFPELQLNQHQLDAKGNPVRTKDWTPKVIGIGHRSCHTTRLEKMDANGVINYCYCSNRWLDKPFIDQGGTYDAPIIAIPCLDMTSPLNSLEEHIRKARTSNVAVKDRPTRVIMPTVYPTAGRPYYPTPPWHSIFGGDIYEYISTIISDRFNRKKNSNVIGRIIYLNQDYIRQCSVQTDAEGNTRSMEEWCDQFYSDINTWLSNRDNAGQSLLAFTFTGSDGQEHKSFEVLEIESTSNSEAAANEKETAEVSSIIFMSLGLDARLLGSSPLSLVGGNSGTDIRERFLLRQILMSPTQNLMLIALNVASDYNKWDKHLIWDVQREVMTTLDNSKTGITTAETE